MPKLCCIMEVTTLVIILVCAAPPASSSVMVAMMKDSVTSNLVKRDLINLPSNPPLPAHSLSFSCPGPGIFADQESGCQVSDDRVGIWNANFFFTILSFYVEDKMKNLHIAFIMNC